MAAAYVKWIEAAGGRAVPIRFYVSDGELRRLFDSVNGVIFPGEGTIFSSSFFVFGSSSKAAATEITNSLTLSHLIFPFSIIYSFLSFFLSPSFQAASPVRIQA